LLAAVIAVGCAGAGTDPVFFSVKLRTDFRPGTDFVQVTTELAAREGTPRPPTTLDAEPEMDFANGVMVLDRTRLAQGTYTMRVTLMDSSARSIAFVDRVASVTSTGEAVLTLERRSCDGVTCNAGDRCINGKCIDPACLEDFRSEECEPPRPPDGDSGAPHPDAGIEPCQGTATRACMNGACQGVQRCEGGTWSPCDAQTPTAESLNGQDDNCDGNIDEEHYTTLHQVAFSALGNGCTGPSSAWANCQAAADAFCRTKAPGHAFMIGGFGPVTYQGATATVACTAKAGGAQRIQTTVSALQSDPTEIRTRIGFQKAVDHCKGLGYPVSPGIVAWDGPTDNVWMLCMPAAYGTTEDMLDPEELRTRGCADFEKDTNTPVCTKAAHRYCLDQGYLAGAGPHFIWVYSPVTCFDGGS
ncbi:MAG: hypothetical protein KC416_06785, partial [Myxococcales bacterium]|nr:hypothetical protein [Myxococcales bacterium]